MTEGLLASRLEEALKKVDAATGAVARFAEAERLLGELSTNLGTASASVMDTNRTMQTTLAALTDSIQSIKSFSEATREVGIERLTGELSAFTSAMTGVDNRSIATSQQLEKALDVVKEMRTQLASIESGFTESIKGLRADSETLISSIGTLQVDLRTVQTGTAEANKTITENVTRLRSSMQTDQGNRAREFTEFSQQLNGRLSMIKTLVIVGSVLSFLASALVVWTAFRVR